MKDIYNAVENGTAKINYSFCYGDGNDSIYVTYKIVVGKKSLYIDTLGGDLWSADSASYYDENDVEKELMMYSKDYSEYDEDEKMASDILEMLGGKLKTKIEQMEWMEL